jgi:hypothetical protein
MHPESIAEGVDRYWNAFQRIFEDLGQYTEDEHLSRIRHGEVRLRAWSQDHGAHRTDKSSLDERYRGAQYTRGLVIESLERIEDLLIHVLPLKVHVESLRAYVPASLLMSCVGCSSVKQLCIPNRIFRIA